MGYIASSLLIPCYRHPLAIVISRVLKCTASSTILPMHPFRFGVQLKSSGSIEHILSVVSRVESLGYDVITVPDHIDESMSPFVLLGYLASKTGLTLGTMVLSNDFRSPVIVAREAAALATISQGRFELGVGAGWQGADYLQMGLSMESPSVRVSRLEEALSIIKDAFSKEEVSFDGKFYQLDRFALHPRLSDEVVPKLVVGGGGKRVLSIAARFGDVVSINPSLRHGEYAKETLQEMSEESYLRKCEWVQSKLGALGRSVELHCRSAFVYVGDDHYEVVSQMAGSFGLDPLEAYKMPPLLIGSVDDVVQQLLYRRQRFGFSYWSVHEGDVESFAPVVNALKGR
jgi:probable F420-dependent oxidoreductase